MALADTSRAGVEAELREAMLTGQPADWRTGDATADDPTHGGGWDAQRTVPAELLVELLTDAKGPRPPRGLWLAGARIVGQLKLGATQLACPLLLECCWFAELVVVAEAQAPALRLPGCHLPGLSADQLTTRGNLELSGGFTARGEVRLSGAHIGGDLDLNGATLTDPDGKALTADWLTVDQAMFCREGFNATGEVRLRGAHIGGDLDLRGATLTNPNGYALNAVGLTVDHSMSCRYGIIQGEISLLRAHISGELDFAGATLTNPNGDALTADWLTVDQDMFCREGFNAIGEVRLPSAHIGGHLELGGAIFTNPSGYALNAYGLTVNQAMLCSDGFIATGEVSLAGAHIRELDFAGATLTNPNGDALTADRLTVDQEISCSDGFTARGEVRLPSAHIGGTLDLGGAIFTNPSGTAVHLQEAYVGVLVLRPATAPSRVNLTQAKVGVLDDNEDTWPDELRLVGFTYDALAEHSAVSVQNRLAWLRRDPDGYNPQPYEHLAAVYRRDGRDQDARTVAIAKQRARRRTLGRAEHGRRTLGRAEWLWSVLLDGLVGYGYRTWLAGVWLAGFSLVGWVVFNRAHANEELVLAKPGEAHPGFHGAVYALDTLLPVVDLHHQALWIPRGGSQWWAWAWILAGWVLTTAVVAALTGLLKRD